MFLIKMESHGETPWENLGYPTWEALAEPSFETPRVAYLGCNWNAGTLSTETLCPGTVYQATDPWRVRSIILYHRK